MVTRRPTLDMAPVRLVVIQPGTFCNINCTYCYLPDRAMHRRMSPATLQDTVRFLFRDPAHLASNIVIAWHSGEPLAVPISFYESAFQMLALQAPPDCAVQHWLQTNATLITQEWCDFIRRWRIQIGVSIDGPRQLNDFHRLDRLGRGTFDRAQQGINLLLANCIRFSTITVLSSKNIDSPKEIWTFLRDLGVTSLAFNFENQEGAHRRSSLQSDNAEYHLSRAQSFIAEILALRDREASLIAVREIDHFLDGLTTWPSPCRAIENVPLCVICVAWNGDISAFSPELMGLNHPHYGDFVIGHVACDTVDSIQSNTKFQLMFQEITEGVNLCRSSCDYFALCGGGCPSSKLFENAAFKSSETLACRFRIKAVGNAVFQFLEDKHGLPSGNTRSVRERATDLRAAIHNDAVPHHGDRSS